MKTGFTETMGIRLSSDVAIELDIAEPIDSFATWFWDYDNDGWLDILWRDTGKI